MLTLNLILAVLVPVGPVLLALGFVYLHTRRAREEDTVVFKVAFENGGPVLE